jgi:hypothetical protein
VHPNQAALCNMGIFSNFMKNIGEDERWSGRTQSGASWSPEQLRRGLRLQVETVTIEDRTDRWRALEFGRPHIGTAPDRRLVRHSGTIRIPRDWALAGESER